MGSGGLTVSHKFGERDRDGVKQFHDCGIVYYPQRPYLLCVMTRGQDFEKLNGAVSEIASAVLDEMKSF